MFYFLTYNYIINIHSEVKIHKIKNQSMNCKVNIGTNFC
jgi:hypothetical protein